MTAPRLAIGAALAAIGIAGGLNAAAASAPHPESAGGRRCCAIVELRQYTLHPDRFDGFVKLFEETFFDPLEAAGMTVIGQFRDLDDPNRFVWLRGFRDMPARAAALSAFYDGPVWKARRSEANDNFTDTDNVLLLHPAFADSGVPVAGDGRLPPAAQRSGEIVITVYPLEAGQAGEFPAWFRRAVEPALRSSGIAVTAAFETESSKNNFPRLPVREGEHVFVWIAGFGDRARADAALESVTRSNVWAKTVAGELQRRLIGNPQVLRLQPTARSRLRGG